MIGEKFFGKTKSFEKENIYQEKCDDVASIKSKKFFVFFLHAPYFLQKFLFVLDLETSTFYKGPLKMVNKKSPVSTRSVEFMPISFTSNFGFLGDYNKTLKILTDSLITRG